MGKIAFVFPGQGSQYVGMGRELVAEFPEAKRVFDQAGSVLGPDFVEIIMNGPDEALKQTAVTQPAILTVSVAALRVLETYSVMPDFVAGHSLGEYSAHVAAGTFSFETALQVVRERGRLMQEITGGAMAAILGLDRQLIERACEQASDMGIVEVANYNCPGQVVISGQAEAVNKAAANCKEAGAKRAIPLAVSGPFHCSLMKPAAEGLARVLSGVEYGAPQVPLAANINGQFVQTREDVAGSLVQQVNSSVRWEECIHTLHAAGAQVFIEVGPGKVLAGLTKKIVPGAGTANVEDLSSLEKSLAYLKESR